MARSIEKENSKDIKKLIKLVTNFEESDENFAICQQFVISNLKYHRFLHVDSHKVTRQLEGVSEKFRVHSETFKAAKFQEYLNTFLNAAVFEGNETGKTDTHYAILLFLLLVSQSPVKSEYVETKKETALEVKDTFNWGAYLLHGIERYIPSDEDLSDWSEEDEDSSDEKKDRVDAPLHSMESTKVVSLEHGDRQVMPSFISGGNSASYEGQHEIEATDWLKRNLITQYWKGEKIEFETGRYRACQLNNDWEAYKERVDPLYGNQRKIVVTENVLLREVIWMLMGVSNLHLFVYNARTFVPRQEIVVPHLSEEALYDCLAQFARHGTYTQALKNFVDDCNNGEASSTICQTYHAFATSVAEFLQMINAQLCTIEQKLIRQEEIVTLFSLWKDIQPLLQKVTVVFIVYMRGIYHSQIYKLPSQKATLILTTIYNALLCCDTLFESLMVEDVPISDSSYDPADMLRLLLPMWIQTCRPYINIVDGWISHGYLTDPYSEFIIQRNKDVSTLDETFWEKSFSFHTMSKSPEKSDNISDDKPTSEYNTMDWAPKFLQPVLQQIVLTGKSMEMLESLGKLAEHDGKSYKDNLIEFQDTGLYGKFIISLTTLLGAKSESATGEHSGDKTYVVPVFSVDIERQMQEKGIKDTFLIMYFENIMNVKSDSHMLLDKTFTETMKHLDLDQLHPVELILQECLYPLIHHQYERVCLKLVHTLTTEYNLIGYLKAMRRFFLMEAGDTMFIFYTEIFNKIRLQEQWKNTATVFWALHEALDQHYPDEAAHLSVTVEKSDGECDTQLIHMTNCIRLQYQIPSPLDVVINEKCQQIYNQIFSFLLQVKRAKYCLDELRFCDLAKESVQFSSADQLQKCPRGIKIHKMHLLRMRLINFVNSLHNYIMTRILHSIGLEFTRDLSAAKDLDQIIDIHSIYIRKIHERCLLHSKNVILKEAVLKVLNLALTFQTEWDNGIDNISLKQIEGTETEFSRCLFFLRSFLNSVIQRGSFPHLESLAFSLDNLIPK